MSHRQRGPQGRLHLPRWTHGCWAERPATCCWLCRGRLVLAALRARWRYRGERS